jgi:hypothetical protein
VGSHELNLKSGLSELGLDPYTVHSLLIFPVLNHSVKILALYRLEALLFKQRLHLLCRKVVRAGFVLTHVKVVFDLRPAPL